MELGTYFIIQHLLKATHLRKKNDTGFKKDVWIDLQRSFNLKFTVIPPLNTSQFHTHGQVINSYSLNNGRNKTIRSFELLLNRVALNGTL